MTQQCSPEIVARLRIWTIDWNGAPMDDREPPRDGFICKDLRDAADEIERLRAAAQSAPEQISFVEALSLAERGLELWKAKEHNAKWWRRIDGTPIPNDLLVNIAEEFSKCGLVYASTLPSAQCGDPIPSSPDVSAPDRRPPE